MPEEVYFVKYREYPTFFDKSEKRLTVDYSATPLEKGRIIKAWSSNLLDGGLERILNGIIGLQINVWYDITKLS